MDSSPTVKYIYSLYWALTTMTTCGYGDIHPTSSIERLASMFAMLASSGVFGHVIASIGRIVRNYNTLATSFRERINYV